MSKVADLTASREPFCNLTFARAPREAHFRDTQQFMAILLQIWFYAPPIVYPITVVPEKVHLFGRLLPARSIHQLHPRLAEAL